VSELPLPAAAKKSVAAKGINEFRNLVILARNVARYSSQLGVGQSCWCVCIPVYVLCLCVGRWVGVISVPVLTSVTTLYVSLPL